jgi:hypothetical protein
LPTQMSGLSLVLSSKPCAIYRASRRLYSERVQRAAMSRGSAPGPGQLPSPASGEHRWHVLNLLFGQRNHLVGAVLHRLFFVSHTGLHSRRPGEGGRPNGANLFKARRMNGFKGIPSSRSGEEFGLDGNQSLHWIAILETIVDGIARLAHEFMPDRKELLLAAARADFRQIRW